MRCTISFKALELAKNNNVVKLYKEIYFSKKNHLVFYLNLTNMLLLVFCALTLIVIGSIHAHYYRSTTTWDSKPWFIAIILLMVIILLLFPEKLFFKAILETDK